MLELCYFKDKPSTPIFFENVPDRRNYDMVADDNGILRTIASEQLRFI